MKAIIWDLDNTIYQSPQGFFQTCCEAAADCAIAHGYSDERDAALQAVYASFKKNGYALAGLFQELAVDRAIVEPVYVNHVAGLLSPCFETRRYIEQFEGPQMILSHSNEAWVNAIATQLDLDELIPLCMRLFAENVGHEGKKLSIDPFKQAATLLGHDPQDIGVFEDTADNLYYAKNLGMITVLVTNNQPHTSHDFIDYVVSRPHEIAALL